MTAAGGSRRAPGEGLSAEEYTRVKLDDDPAPEAVRHGSRLAKLQSPAVADSLPGAFDDLVCDLKGLGFTITTDERSDAFGDRLVELSNPARALGCTVRLVRDRGLWNTEIEIDGQWHDPYWVVLALDEAKYARRAQSHSNQHRFTLDALNRLPGCPDLNRLRGRLESFRRQYLRDLGIDMQKESSRDADSEDASP